MATSKQAEVYLKTIYGMLTRFEPVTTSTVSRLRHVSPPSASAMLKRLERESLVVRSPDREFTLTPDGELIALEATRRHRLIELFLHRILGFGWHDVHELAEELEPVVRGRLEDRIDEVLGHPTHDPHGDPIPPADLHDHDERWPASLEDAPEGATFLVERVVDRDSDVLRYLGELGVRPGITVVVGERLPFGGPLWLVVDDKRHVLGLPLVRAIHGTWAD